jgi:DNA-binding winged helix-turn-helix (wHTH) protein
MHFLFEDFVLDPARREFTERGAEVILEPQVFDLLVYLVRERTHVVDKDELIRHVWEGRIVSDSTIESRLSLLRKALHDDGRGQRLIRTYARKGVRFVGPVLMRDVSGVLLDIEPTPFVATMGADYVINGTVQHAAGRLRVTFQVVDVHRGHAVWAEHYDRLIDDIFGIQHDIAHAIAQCIGPEMGRFLGKKGVNLNPRP